MRQFPALYVESYFFQDLCAGWIHRLDQNFMSNGSLTVADLNYLLAYLYGRGPTPV